MLTKGDGVWISNAAPNSETVVVSPGKLTVLKDSVNMRLQAIGLEMDIGIGNGDLDFALSIQEEDKVLGGALYQLARFCWSTGTKEITFIAVVDFSTAGTVIKGILPMDHTLDSVLIPIDGVAKSRV